VKCKFSIPDWPPRYSARAHNFPFSELRLELGLPGSGVNSTQYPHIFPSVPNLEDSEAIYSAGTLPGSTPSFETDKAHLVTGWFFYLGEIALMRLKYRILLYRYGNQDGSRHNNPARQSDSDYDLRHSVMEFDLQLDQWYAGPY
jgi:hypothetical protein